MGRWSNTPVVGTGGEVTTESINQNQFFSHCMEHVEKNPKIINELKKLQEDAKAGTNPITNAYDYVERKRKKGGW